MQASPKVHPSVDWRKCFICNKNVKKAGWGCAWLKDTGRGSWESQWSPTSRVIAEIGKAKEPTHGGPETRRTAKGRRSEHLVKAKEANIFSRKAPESPIWRGVMYPLKSANYKNQLSTDLTLARRNSLAEVRLQEGEPLENALRRFKRKVQTEDIIKEVKRHSYYLKPGEKKRVKQALARKRAKKKIRKDRDSRPDRD